MSEIRYPMEVSLVGDSRDTLRELRRGLGVELGGDQARRFAL